jgi:hypothetical protein
MARRGGASVHHHPGGRRPAARRPGRHHRRRSGLQRRRPDRPAGRAKSAYRDIVLLNAAAAFLVADKVETLREGVELAGAVLDDGRAARPPWPAWSPPPTAPAPAEVTSA